MSLEALKKKHGGAFLEKAMLTLNPEERTRERERPQGIFLNRPPEHSVLTGLTPILGLPYPCPTALRGANSAAPKKHAQWDRASWAVGS